MHVRANLKNPKTVDREEEVELNDVGQCPTPPAGRAKDGHDGESSRRAPCGEQELPGAEGPSKHQVGPALPLEVIIGLAWENPLGLSGGASLKFELLQNVANFQVFLGNLGEFL